MPTPKKVETWKLSRLHAHPRQAATFPAPTESKIEELMEDMREHGLRQPLVVLSDGTIICGHGRSEAARRLGWETISVVVRRDLEGDEVAVERLLIADNLNRRQLSKLDQARAYLRLKHLACRRGPGNLSLWDTQELQERLAKLVGEKRNMDRYFAVLRTPMAVQSAFDRHDLTLTQAAKVATLPPPQQAEIAAAIEAGEVPKEVVANSLAREDNPQTPLSAYHKLLRAIEAAATDLDGRVERLDLPMPDCDRRLNALERGLDLLKRLMRGEDQAQRRAKAALAKLIKQRRPKR